MNILFTTLNSKFIHCNLALKYLSKCVENAKVETKEYTINEDIEAIFFDIMQGGYDLVAFSCYIWNIEKTLKIIRNIKKAKPDVKILLGGPEVSYDVEDFLTQHPEVDLIVAGEGEIAFQKMDQYYKKYMNSQDCPETGGFLDRMATALASKELVIPNLYLNLQGAVQNYATAQERQVAMVVQDLSRVPHAYEEITAADIQNKIIYYETSRGCNYNCSYCLSATQKGIRFFEEARVFKELKQLVGLGAKQIKFVDRTFNSDPVRTRQLIEFIQEIDNGDINFHFEITAHLLTEEQIQMLVSARPGLFQLEIGVQSTHRDTLVAVNRGNHFEKLSQNVQAIKKAGNIHQHLDLIAGLPYENLERFKKSFNDVFALRPEMLQLGFLKFLKGSPIYQQVKKYGYQFRDYPPYEVIANRFISFEDLMELKEVEHVLDRYYNKQRYRYSIEYILGHFSDAYAMFKSLADVIQTEKIELNQKNEEFRAMLLLSQALPIQQDFFMELLRMDYLMMGRNPNLPDFLKSSTMAAKEEVFEILSEEENLIELGFGQGTTAKEAFKKINWSVFDYDVIVYYNTHELIKNKNIVLINYGMEKKDMAHFKTMRRNYESGN